MLPTTGGKYFEERRMFYFRANEGGSRRESSFASGRIGVVLRTESWCFFVSFQDLKFQELTSAWLAQRLFDVT